MYVCLRKQLKRPALTAGRLRAQDAGRGQAGLDRLKRSLQELHGAEEAALDTHVRLVDQTATMRSTLSKVRVAPRAKEGEVRALTPAQPAAA